jgi:hypothetical protein
MTSRWNYTVYIGLNYWIIGKSLSFRYKTSKREKKSQINIERRLRGQNYRENYNQREQNT